MLPREAAQGGTSNQRSQDTHGQIPANAINAHKHTEGARGFIALAPRMTKRTIKQGYTSTGFQSLMVLSFEPDARSRSSDEKAID